MPGFGGESGVLPATSEKSKHTAAMLSRFVRFIDAFCTDITPNYPRFGEVILNPGVDLDQRISGDMLSKSPEYAKAYRKDVMSSCERA